MKDLEWTGERLVTTVNNQYGTYEHLHRYALAREFCKEKSVLDIACGEGYGSNLLSQVASQVIGVDISQDAIMHASAKYLSGNLIFKLGSTSNIPCDDNSIDVIVSFETIEHTTEHIQMFCELRRVIKDDGILIISSPERSIYYSRDPNNKFHVKELTLNELMALINKSFVNTNVLSQRIVIGSLLEPLMKDSHKFMTFAGDFTKIEYILPEYEFFNKPFFNIIICSNQEINTNDLPLASFFNAYEVYKNVIDSKDYKINLIRNSQSYRLGHFLLSPVRFLIRIWKKFAR